MEKQTVIITGASRGIGAKMAEVFASSNYNVIINYNKSIDAAVKLERDLLALGYSVKAVKADVTNRKEVDHMLDVCVNTFGTIDVLINNAGIANYGLFTELSDEDWDEIMAINLKSMFICSQSALRYMLPNKQGHILNISSIWGITGASCEVAYSASKAAVIGLTKALAKELGPSSIYVNCIAPGVIHTDMLSDFTEDEIRDIKSQIPINRLGTTDDIAQLALLLTSKRDGFLTGQVISPNGGMLI